MGPAIDAMLTMRPAFRSMKYGVIALHVRKTDLVLTVKVRSQSSSVLFVNGMPGGPAAPALLTRMSILPNVSRVRSTIVLTSAALVTSVFMARTLRPSPLTSPATFSAFSTWMSGIATSAPSRAIASTMPRPIPLPPPVTTATLPSSRMKSPSIYSRCPGSTHDSTPAQKPQLVRAERPRGIRASRLDQTRSFSPAAIAGRVGMSLPLTRFDELSKTTLPFLVNLRPSGKYLMEDFFYAGGLPAVLKELLPLLHGGALTVNGHTIADNVKDARCWNQDVIRPLGMPLAQEGGTVILSGNLCPDGAVLKQSAASPHLLVHRGRAVVFEDHDDLHRRIDDPGLPIDETSVLVLKHAGPRGAPGMPEWGAAPIPARLLKRGIKDLVRISDARMSGTSYGTVVLHVAPESAVGGPLALVRDGDEIELDVPKRTLTLRVADEELGRRRLAWKPRPPRSTRGYGRLFLDHVLQANEGCDFDFLRGRTPVRAEDTAGPSHS